MRVAINGFGRIGRGFYRALEASSNKKIQIVAINDMSKIDTLAYMLKYDSVHGIFAGNISVNGNMITAGKNKFEVLCEKDPANLPWKRLKIDVVIESTGFFTDKELAQKHITAGALKVIISAPAKNPDATIVLGVNEKTLNKANKIISNASCTTNCVAPMAHIINTNFGIQKATMLTTHAYTNDQRILDLSHDDLRRSRAAALSQIPTSTGAAKAIGDVIPDLKGKMDGIAIRVPVPDGSLVELVCVVDKETNVETVNNAFKNYSKANKNIMQYNTEMIVSSDIIGNIYSCVFDSTLTKVLGGNMIQVFGWYDNEVGYSNRLIDLLSLL